MEAHSKSPPRHMEAIFCLRAAIVPPSTRPHCFVGFHPTSGLAPVRHLSFPRSWRRHHGVSCSQVPPRPPPLEEDEGKKGRSGGRKVTKVAAVGVAVVAACTLVAVGLSHGAPVALALPRTVPIKDNSRSAPIQGQSGGGGGSSYALACHDPSSPCNMTVQTTRDTLRAILFGLKDLSATGTTDVSSKNCFARLDMYEVGICLVQTYIGKKDYHLAKYICQQIYDVKPEHDARPCLFKAVIYMMLTVERMLADSPTTTMSSDQPKTSIENDLKDLDILIGKAKTSWEEYKELEPFAFEPITNDGQKDTDK